MAHGKNYQVANQSHENGTAAIQDKDKPMDCSDEVNQENNQIIQQLCEITGTTFDQALNAFIAANGSAENAVTFLTNPQEMKDGTSQKVMQTSVVKNCQTSKDDIIDLTKDKDERDEDLEKAIALSLQESHSSAPQGITAEEQDISRVLEASLIENKSGLKRKRGDPWMTFVDPVNPHERKRVDGTPVGFKNVGNTCWFSAVVQSLFHLPVFRKLVLNCTLPEITQKDSKGVHRITFMQELRKLFALLIGSKRKYVDPTKAVEILKEALQYNGSESNPGNQQDVSEFSHKLLEWLEDTFKVESCAASCKQDNANPVMELFFGQSKVEGVYEGKQFSNLEMFGAYPVQVQGYSNLHDSLEGGMARREIEPANNVHTHKSDQEHWFTRLPAVLKFMLSRFLFNQNTGRAEKIHERFGFDKTIYMDRYLEKNKDITRIRREEVKKLKERHQLLRNSLDSYIDYGTDVRHTHIQDILDSSLRFVQSTPPTADGTECCDVEMKSVIPDSPRSQGSTSVLRPAPRYISQTEYQTIETCLKRWRTEIEQDIQVISKSLKEVEESISIMYDDEEMKKVPYRLHAVLVHEGQASGGHYWAYIYNPIDNQWRKFNDITVSQVTWDEVERESLGGYRHVSAYGLMYVDITREQQVLASETPDDLPEYLQRMVDEDNVKFEKELVEWDEKQAAISADGSKASPDDKSKVAAISSRPDLVLDAEASCVVSPHEHTPITETSSLQDIDNLLSKMCATEKLRLEKIATDQPPNGLCDFRLEYIGHYLIQCGAPQYVIEYTILKKIVDDTKSRDDGNLRIKRRAIELLNKPADAEETEELKKWKEKYQVFQRVSSCFLTGLEHLHNHKYQDALPYLVHAYSLNHKLEDTAFPSQSMDEKLLAFCRRRCFLELNQHAIALFEAQDHSTLCEGLDLMSELVVPCIPTLFSSPHAEDREAVEQIRNKWFTYLGGSMLDEQRREKLQDFLPKLLDVTSEGHQEIRPPPLLRPNARDLCERFTKAMELVHANMAFSAKA